MLDCSFFISHMLVWLYEIELYHMGKNNRNLDLVCENHGLSGTHSLYFYYWFFKGTLVTRERVEEAFRKDIQIVLKEVFIWSNDCNRWPAEVKQIISNMMFNMGRPSMEEFVNFK